MIFNKNVSYPKNYYSKSEHSYAEKIFKMCQHKPTLCLIFKTKQKNNKFVFPQAENIIIKETDF